MTTAYDAQRDVHYIKDLPSPAVSGEIRVLSRGKGVGYKVILNDGHSVENSVQYTIGPNWPRMRHTDPIFRVLLADIAKVLRGQAAVTTPHRQPVPGVYRHYKGGRYIVMGVGEHTETGEGLVFYYSEPKVVGEPFRFWARPLEKFFEQVRRPEYGYVGPRFVRVGELP